MADSKTDFVAILRTLVEHRIDFMIVGGVAAVLHGAPISTFDLDLVHSQDPANLDRLLSALDTLEARYRTSRNLRPDRSHLASPGHQLLMTKFGPLDLLGTIGTGHAYEELLPASVLLEIETGLSVRALHLREVIRTKEEVGGEKDRATLAILRRVLEEKGSGGK